MKNNIKFFLAGGIFGLLLFVIIFFIPSGPPTPILNKILEVAYFPARIVNPVDSILHWIANIFNSNFDRGLGFDGGPLEWVEWGSIIIAMVVWYGLIFFLIALIVELIKKRKN